MSISSAYDGYHDAAAGVPLPQIRNPNTRNPSDVQPQYSSWSDMKQFVLLFAIASLAPLTFAAPTTKPIFTLNDGDRIAFIGNTFVEREQKADYIETMLISRFPRANVTFRNLGYSADTATGEARGLCAGWTQFEKPDKAFERLRKLVAEFKPTVLLINYG